MITKADIITFDWKELHDKTVRVAVTESGGFRVVGLYCNEDDRLYFVEVKQIGEMK